MTNLFENFYLLDSRKRTKFLSLAAALALGMATVSHADTGPGSNFDVALAAVKRAPSGDQWARLGLFLQDSDVLHYEGFSQRLSDAEGNIIVDYLLFKSGALITGSPLAREACSRVFVDHVKYWGMAVAAFDLCRSSGGILTSDRKFAEIYEIYQKALVTAQEDKATLAEIVIDARARPDGMLLSSVAYRYLTYGNPVMAETLSLEALQKSAPPPNKVPAEEWRDIIMLRLGMAQVDQGKLIDAETTFAKVKGRREPVARLWRAFVATRR